MDSGTYEDKSFTHNAHSIGVCEFHLQWCTKYRYETLLKESHFKDCERAIRSAAERHGIEVRELSVMSDHVHVVVLLPQDVSPAKAVGLLKGASAYAMFQLHPNFRLRYPRGHFWGRGYFYRSVSEVSEEVVRRYVREDNDPRQTRLN